MRYLLLVLLAVSAMAHAEEPLPFQKARAACDQLTDKGKHPAAQACLTKLRKGAGPVELRALFYSQLTSLIAQNKLDEAQQHVADHIEKHKGDPEGWEIWLHNASNWVAWARGDLPRAVVETEGMLQALKRIQLPREHQRNALLHYAWDRAYLLLDLALATPPPARGDAIAKAQQARQAYHSVADPQHEADGLAVLDAYFALRLGHGKEALDRVAKVDRSPNGDLQDQYIVALALEAGGDKLGAERLRKIIRTSKNVYPMKALIVRQLPLDKKKSPIGTPDQ